MADTDTPQINGKEVKEETVTETVTETEAFHAGGEDAPGKKTKEEIVTETEAAHAGGGDAPGKVNITGEVDPLLDAKIIRQIEYYFGDINLPRDKFLQEQVKLKDGWVPLDVLLSFKRLAALTLDKKVIVSALKKSTNNLIEISEDESELRRDPERPLPEMNEERRKELMTRTLYMKGFPQTSTLDEILEFMNKLTVVENVIMRSYRDKALNTWLFKGSVFAVFPTKSAADKFIKQDPFKFKEGDEEFITLMWQNDYIESKRKERLDIKNQKRQSQTPDDEDDKEEEKDSGFPKNAVLHFSGCPSDFTRELIKEKMEELDVTVAYVDYQKGDEEGWVRLQDEGQALEIIEKAEEGKIKIGETSIALRALEGEEEATFLEKVKSDIAKRRNHAHRGRRGRRGGGYGGRGNYNRKRKGSPTSNRGTPAKVAAKDS